MPAIYSRTTKREHATADVEAAPTRTAQSPAPFERANAETNELGVVCVHGWQNSWPAIVVERGE